LVFAMPDRPTRPNHHLVSADDVIASSLVKKFDTCILHLFQSYCQELCMEGSRGVLFNPNAILKSRTVHNLRQVMRSA